MGNSFSSLLSLTSRTETVAALPIGLLIIARYLRTRIPPRPFIKSSYDYIIVGAGSSGCVIANRLSADPNTTVLLIEAGGNDDSKDVKIPLACGNLQRTAMDWQYHTTTQQKSCLGMTQHRSNWPRGKMLGGCSSNNYMLYVRGNQADYDGWAKNGCPGWSWEDVLPYFKRSEGHTSNHPAFYNTVYHSRTGPLKVSEIIEANETARLFVEAANDCGIPKVVDYNGETQLGASLSQLTQINGERCSASRAFLDPQTRVRPNLTILTGAHVTRVLFDEHKQATGVTYQFGPKEPVNTVLAKREVVLSAGSIGTPHILLLSGVGPAHHLQQHNIPVVSDLPGVGQNLLDHLFCAVSYTSKVPTISKRSVNLWVILNYMFYRKGLLTSNGLEATAFFQTGHRPDLGPAPDCQLHFVAASGDQRDQENFGIKPEFQKSAQDSRHTFSCFSTLLHPKSKGSITLSSSDPFEHPIINPNYLDHPDDIKTLTAGLRCANRILKSDRFEKIRGPAPRSAFANLAPYPEEFPKGADEYSMADTKDLSDQAWEWWIRHTAATVYHPTSTAKMGPISDPMTVVDPQLRVFGVTRLRCADASIMPDIVSGNTNAPCIMIGEKAADLLKHSTVSARSSL